MEIDRETLAWVAGIMDGEGCFYASKARRIQIAVNQRVDEDGRCRMIERLAAAIPFGKSYGPREHRQPEGVGKKRWRPYMRFQVSGFQNVQAVVSLLWPWLGEVKRQQAEGALRRCH